MTFERSEALSLMAQRRFVPFHYEHESQTFHFGEQVRPLADIPAHGVLHRAGGNLDSSDSEALLATTAFASSFNRMHSLPLADLFFNEAWNDRLIDDTNEVMRDAYIAARSLDPNYDVEAWAPERREFSTLLYEQATDPSGHAGVFLQTSGICACTKPDKQPDLTYYPADVMTYIDHNVSKQADRVSLLAGLGHIARQANEYVRPD